MHTIQINKFRNTLLVYITVVLLFVFLFIFVSYAVTFANHNKETAKKYANKVEKILKHTIKHNVQIYTLLARSIAKTSPLPKMLKNNDREGAIKVLLPKYLLMKQENPFLRVMQVHKKDGTSWIRFHKLNKYGDDIAKHRKMLQNIHKNHKIIHGYETGLYATAYRVIVPIFDENSSYLGAIEIGLHPSFILRSIKEIGDSTGMVFIKEDKLKLYSKPNKVSIDGYRLQSKLTPQLQEVIKNNQNLKLKDNQQIQIRDKKYLTHLISMKDFQGNESVKILFFQNLNNDNLFFNKTQFYLFLLIAILFVGLLYLIYKKVNQFQKSITTMYEKTYNQLYNAKQNLENVFNAVPNMMIASDGEEIVMTNRAMLDYLHYDNLDEFKKEHKCVCEFFMQQDGFLQADMNGLTWVDYALSHKKINKVAIKTDDEVKYFIIYVTQVQIDDKNLSLVSFADISEIEILTKRLDYAVNSTNDGLWDWNLITNEIYYSDKWKAMLGYAPDELKNEFQTWEKLAHPDDVAKIKKDISDSHAKVTAFYENIYRLRHKDGHWVWILNRSRTLYDKKNKPIRMIGFYTDISRQKELENELRASKEEFELFMNNIPHIVVIKDENFKVIYANSTVKKYIQHNIVGKSAMENLDKEVAHKVNELSNIALKEGSAEDLIMIHIGEKSIMARVLAFKIPQKNQKNYIGMLYMDITDSYKDKQLIKEQEELMIAQSRHAAMGEMISMIVHQWRQPISVIAMDVNNILADIELEMLDEQTLLEGAKDVIAQTEELSKTIDDFRNFFKPDKIPEKVLLSNVVDDVLTVILKSLENNDIKLELNLKPNIELLTYARELMQVLINIVKNAKEALVEKEVENKKIKISSSLKDEHVVIEVLDNAGGIPQDIQKSIFNPYFSTKGEKNGTGLGLYMSKTIVDKHLHGTIEMKNIENGACFVITLPMTNQERAIDV